MPNRLAQSTSPYLRQHQDNPVDWYEWGEEAFARARELDRPIFLSVGYSSCHWCHVMAHESFEDPEIGALLNELFVSIKVDREERPDVDEAYMTAVHLSSGRGGWPMSVFLTPEGKPFFAGTYFPKDDRGQYAGFRRMLGQISALWRNQREDILKTSEQFAVAVRETLGRTPPENETMPSFELIDAGVKAQMESFDPEHGGFGGAPKFPPHTAIDFLLRYAIAPDRDPELRQAAFGMAVTSLSAMCLGGIHDHVGGGFHRYSTDERWLLPHFEKMLVDNGLMLTNLARAAAILDGVEPTLAALFQNAAIGIVRWLDREMKLEGGLFASALDADSEGEEGAFYVWSREELIGVLGASDEFLLAFGVTEEGNFEDEATGQRTGKNVLHLRRPALGEFDEPLARLLEARASRERPLLDHKALVGWNGLVIAALAEFGVLDLALGAAEAILRAERAHGRLPRQITLGQPSGLGYLEDYAYFALGLLEISDRLQAMNAAELANDDPMIAELAGAMRSEARRVAHEAIDRFWSAERGCFLATSAEHEDLFGRTVPVFDQPQPSPNAVLVRVLLRLGITAPAEQTLVTLQPWMVQAPTSTEALHIAALENLLTGFVELEEIPGAAAEPEAAAPPAPVVRPKVQVQMPERELIANEDGMAHGRIRVSVPEGWHLNSNVPPARWLVPTQVTIEPVKSIVQYPTAVNDQFLGEFEIAFTVATSGKEAEFEVKLGYQACTDRECLEPEVRTFDCIVRRG